MRYSYLGTDVNFPAQCATVVFLFVPVVGLLVVALYNGQNHGRQLELLFVQLNVPLLL